ncbi:pantoate--beta-alanine ligase [Rhabdothermincola sediminis]|uniref:pantoate--beta-alanine ligase n=1 Tax=Rhabdothermincola sediminis TaxID=2751370 RepID=UPI001AA06492|nr:pantoate--beta-alanine ligase [Rhabdothermincola sediminis]
MEVHETIASIRQSLLEQHQAGRSVGFVPTMGYLHDGHLSLMARSRAECDVTVVSIFVNPLQFAPNEDLSTYPRDLDRDLASCRTIGVDAVFAPDVNEMYPEQMLTSVSVAELGSTMEGAARPAHFTGVATVVTKLFNIVGPCRAYFGEKDYQQLAIVRKMARDLDQPVTVVGCPIVREPDGLAMSSRNVYLDEDERAAAPVLHRALQAGAATILAGERSAPAVRHLMAGIVEAEPLAQLDYAEVVDAATLRPVDPLAGPVRLLVAARFGRTRLLDNLGVEVPARG